VRKSMVVSWMVVAAACGSSSGGKSSEEASDPAGQRAFLGAVALGSDLGTCAFIVAPEGIANGRCTAGASTADLTGTFGSTPDQALAGSVSAATPVPGTGIVTLAGTVGGVSWVFTGSIPAPGLPPSSRDSLGGVLSVGEVTTYVVAMDATLEPATAYCGTFGGTDEGSWLLQVGSATANGVAFTDSGAGILRGTRSGNEVTLTGYDPETSLAAVSANGTVSAGSASGDWAALRGDGAGTWTGAPCPGSNSFVCCGSGAETTCLFAEACPGPGGAVQGSCTMSPLGFTECDEYSGYASVQDSQESCASPAVGGTWSSSACAAENRAGSCTMGNGAGGTTTQAYYSGIPASLLSSIQSNCIRAGGRWTSGG